jgi:hypothetical protein
MGRSPHGTRHQGKRLCGENREVGVYPAPDWDETPRSQIAFNLMRMDFCLGASPATP